jgi:PAS domain S-box-containing protein
VSSPGDLDQEWQLPDDAYDEWPTPAETSTAVLDSLTEPFYVLDRRGNFVEWNDRFREAWGYEDAELATISPRDLVVADQYDRVERALSRAVDGEEVTEQVTTVHKDGTRVPHEFSAAPLTDDDGRVWAIVGTSRDISEREKTREALRERERQFSTLVSNLPGMVYRCRVEEGWPMTFVSDGCDALTGYDPAAIVSGSVSWGGAVIHPDDRETVWESVEAALADDAAFEVTYRIRTSDGETRWVWEQGRKVDTAEDGTEILEGFISDITERERRERELERFERLIDTVGDGVYVLDEDDRLVQVNDALTEMLGYDRSELLGRPVTDLLDAESARAGIERRRKLDEHPDSVETLELELVCEDGSTLPAEARFSLLDVDGDVFTIGLVRDISDRKERAALLEDLHEGARELLAAETVEDVAETATRVAQQYFDYSMAITRLVQDGELEVVSVVTDDDRLDRDWESVPVGEGMVGKGYELGEPMLMEYPLEYDTVIDLGAAESGIFFPIEDWGTIGIVSTDPDAFDETDLELGRVFAADVEAAFRRADREGRLRERTRELERYETLVETMGDGVYMTDADDEIRMVNDAILDLLGYDRETVMATGIGRFTSEAAMAQAGDQGAMIRDGERSVGRIIGEAETADGGTVPFENRFALLPSEDGEFTGTVGVVRDISERVERERRLTEQRDELETLNRVNEVVRETIHSLASAATRREIEETVCERLTESSLYRFAFTGVRRPGQEYVEARTWAGEGAEYLNEVQIAARPDAVDAGPGARSLATGEVTVTHDVETDPLFEPYREHALDYGFRSVAVVPFTHGEVVQGMMAVYADRPEAFSDREIRAFEVLGEMVGFAISATQDRRLIEADTRLEVTFRLPDADGFLTTLSTRLSTSCRLLGSVTATGDGLLHYIAVESAHSESVLAVAEEVAGVDPTAVRLIRAEEGRTVLEVRLTDCVVSLLMDSGFRLVDAVAADGSLEVVAEAPPELDLRTATERLEDPYGSVVLVSKQEVDRWQEGPRTIRERLDETITERQRAALQAAYFGGYFDWPRDSTAEEVADSLDIASATLHQHLRHAQRKLLDTYLTEGGSDPGP